MSEKAIKLINDLRRDISIDIMFTPEKNAEDDSLKALVDYIAELEAEIDEFLFASSNVLNPYDGISVPYEALKKLVKRVRKERER